MPYAIPYKARVIGYNALEQTLSYLSFLNTEMQKYKNRIKPSPYFLNFESRSLFNVQKLYLINTPRFSLLKRPF
jgi:hypothetical protein